MFSYIKRSRKEIKDILYKKDTIFRIKNIVFSKYIDCPKVEQDIYFFSNKTKKIYLLATYIFSDDRYERETRFTYYYTLALCSENGNYNKSYLIDPYTILNCIPTDTYCDNQISFMKIVHDHIRYLVKTIKFKEDFGFLT